MSNMNFMMKKMMELNKGERLNNDQKIIVLQAAVERLESDVSILTSMVYGMIEDIYEEKAEAKEADDELQKCFELFKKRFVKYED